MGSKNQTDTAIEPCEHLHPSWNQGGAQVLLEWMAGCNWCIIWLNCPDMESLIAFGFTKKEAAAAWAKEKNLNVTGVKVHPKGK